MDMDMGKLKSNSPTWIKTIWATTLKHMKDNWDDDISMICKNKTCSKPATSFSIYMYFYLYPNSHCDPLVFPGG